jgi:hypothetical protein
MIQNLKTNNAQKPYIILGTAAKSSIMKDKEVFNFEPAISDRNIAIPKLIGTPIAIAIPEETRVPMIYGKAPNDSLPGTAFQSVLVKKLNPSSVKISFDPSPTAKSIKTNIKRVYAAAPNIIHLKIGSNLDSFCNGIRERLSLYLVEFVLCYASNIYDN